MRKLVILTLLLFVNLSLFAQQGSKASADTAKRIEIIHANYLRTTELYGPDIKILTGEVIFYHDSATMYCDSAFYNTRTNVFKAFGNIELIKATDTDTLYLSSDSLIYYGDTKFAEIRGNVYLRKDTTLLFTDSLNYDAANDIAYYNAWAKTISGKDTLVSDVGYYYSKTSDIFLKGNVKIYDPRYTIKTDTLRYNLSTETAFFFGPTEIVNDSNYIYCEYGSYDQRYEIANVSRNTLLRSREHTIRADSLFYNRFTGIGKAFRNVVVTDTVNDVILKGNYLEYEEESQKSMITGRAYLLQIDNQDTLWLHGDTLYTYVDTLYEIDDTLAYRIVFAYHHVKSYREDMQFKCDSLVYTMLDSSIHMFGSPVIWSDNLQLSSAYAWLQIENNSPKRFFMEDSVFIAEYKDSIYYNQVKGAKLKGIFKEDKLDNAIIYDNIESIYHIFEDSTLIAVNLISSDSMRIIFKDQNVSRIIPYGNIKGKTVPPSSLSEKEYFISGFKWQEEYRPFKPEDIFVWKRQETMSEQKGNTQAKAAEGL